MQKMTTKKLTDRKLVGYLMQQRHIDLISVNKTHVVCTCSPRFLPVELKQIMDETGHTDVKLLAEGEHNYLVFVRV